MTGDVIKSFLVGLGFDVDDAGLAKFNKAVASATLKVAALYGSVKIMSAAIGYSISKISEGFEQMGYEYRIISPMINKALVLRRELLKAYAAAGINITKVVKNSVLLNMSLAKTKFALEAIYKSVGSRFFTLITKQSDLFRSKIYAHMPQILNALERWVKFVFKAFEATVQLGSRLWSVLTRVYDFFVMLDKATDGWSTKILALIAIWKFLNLSFMATPLGMLLTGFLALLALWDDFKTFKEGGQSLIDWGSETTKIMVGLAAGIAAIVVVIRTAMIAFRAFQLVMAAVNLVMALNPVGLLILGITALIALLGVLIWKWDAVKQGFKDFFTGGFGSKILDFFSGIGSKIMNFAGGPNVAANLQNNPTKPGVQSSPLGGNSYQNSQTNQDVKQQTNITVNGAADAQSIGKAVAGEQSRVNFDFVRNLKGATR